MSVGEWIASIVIFAVFTIVVRVDIVVTSKAQKIRKEMKEREAVK